MAKDLIRFDILAQDALRGMLRKLLTEIAQTGLPGEHHFYITFSTKAPGVRISNRLNAQYPEEMTIVLQHQFWDLIVTEHSFEIGLSFNAIPERLHVPFSAIKAFYDPSVQFGLQFDPETAKAQDGDTEANDDAAENAADTVERPSPVRSVQSLDSARPILPSEREQQREEAKRMAEEASRKESEAAAKATAEPGNDADGDMSDSKVPSASDDDSTPDKKPEEESKSADVVSLDAFRKKN
ncbi:MAG: hypothetical protein COA52_04310 [Hyphomicrobiales bacterium]|nr:MAG: hypothetical protein COA52_04310 [Hyphomicrobiales bacterium]